MEETSYSSASRTPLNHQRCIRLSFRGNIILGVGKEFSFKMPIADSQLHQNVETLNSYILGHSSKLNEHIQLPRPLDNGSKADSEAWRNSSRDAFLKPNGDLIPTVSHVADGLAINDGRRTYLADHCGATTAGSPDQFYAHNELFRTDGKDLVANDHELRSISSEISILKNTISCLESKLLLASPRKELLGKDYAGRLFWAFYRPGSTPWILVDCSMLAQERSTSSDHTGVRCGSSASSSSQSDAEENGHFKVGEREPKPKWFSCQSQAEVNELIRWLRCFEPMDNDFIESLLRLQKFEFVEPANVGDIGQGTSQLTLTPQTTEMGGKFCSLATRALVSLERKYGPCSKTDGTIIPVDKLLDEEEKKQVVMYRCGCLELVWTSRHHCRLCHMTYSSSYGITAHNSAECSSGTSASESAQLKGKSADAKAVLGEQEECSEEATPNNLGTGPSTGSELDGVKKGCTSPYELKAVSAKFVTQSSNKVLVKQIGLLGSDGLPSLVAAAASPCLSDPSLKLARGTEGSGESSCLKSGNPLSLTHDSSLRPVTGKEAQFLRQLKICLLDIDAGLHDAALKPSNAECGRRRAWREDIKSVTSYGLQFHSSILISMAPRVPEKGMVVLVATFRLIEDRYNLRSGTQNIHFGRSNPLREAYSSSDKTCSQHRQSEPRWKLIRRPYNFCN